MSNVTGRAIPEAGFFQRYGINVTDLDDISWYPITDHLVYPKDGVQELTFFANGKGQGVTSTPNATGAKKFDDTNLEGHGVLPFPERALIVGISVHIYPGVSPASRGASLNDFVNDMWAIARSGYLYWKVGQKTIVVDGPLMSFGINEGLEVTAALADSTTAAENQLAQVQYARLCGNGYAIIPVALPSSQNFPLTLNWSAPVPTPSEQPARIGVKLHGYRIRHPQ